MAINKNHEFEDLEGVKCAVVERAASQQRVDFIKPLLEQNGFTVILSKTPPPKAAAKPVVLQPDGEAAPVSAPAIEPELPATFTIGVTDVMFNATNAVMGRLLYTKDGHVVTQAYWNQKETLSHDEIPYYAR